MPRRRTVTELQDIIAQEEGWLDPSCPLPTEEHIQRRMLALSHRQTPKISPLGFLPRIIIPPFSREQNHVFKKSGGAQETEGVVAGAVGEGVRYLLQYPSAKSGPTFLMLT
jgi:hypothetical protein